MPQYYPFGEYWGFEYHIASEQYTYFLMSLRFSLLLPTQLFCSTFALDPFRWVLWVMLINFTLGSPLQGESWQPGWPKWKNSLRGRRIRRRRGSSIVSIASDITEQKTMEHQQNLLCLPERCVYVCVWVLAIIIAVLTRFLPPLLPMLSEFVCWQLDLCVDSCRQSMREERSHILLWWTYVETPI